MATEAKVQELTQAIQDCITQKLKDGYDANAQFTLDIAREVAEVVETKAADYTDVEIAKIKLLIGEHTDLTDILAFMQMIKDLTDGDESQEGFQIFDTLVADTVNNKQTIITLGNSITLLTSTVATIQAALTDHETRIAFLESLDHGNEIDCETCHDGILDLIKDAHAAACAASSAVISAYQASRAASLKASFSDEIDPITLIVNAGSTDDNKLEVTGDYTGIRVASITVVFSDLTVAQAVVDDGDFVATSIAAEPALTGNYTVQAFNAAGVPVGAPVVQQWISPSLGGGGGEGDGAIL